MSGAIGPVSALTNAQRTVCNGRHACAQLHAKLHMWDPGVRMVHLCTSRSVCASSRRPALPGGRPIRCPAARAAATTHRPAAPAPGAMSGHVVFRATDAGSATAVTRGR